MSRIITFYSYKGGVGRTFALANIAVWLAQNGKRVLLMDWDLEAPGLHRYFADYTKKKRKKKGIIHLLDTVRENDSSNWEPFISEINLPQKGKLDLITSGDQSADYSNLVRQFSWVDFFGKYKGAAILDRWRNEWKQKYDFILIDSRTGITDTGGVCTVFLPDILVLVFSANNQSLERGVQVALGVQESRRNLDVSRPPLAILPIPGRFDGRDEIDESAKWMERFSRDLKPFYNDWLPSRFEPKQILELTKVPYISKFSFGEPLPLLTHGITDPELPGFYLANSARLLNSDFKDSIQLLDPDGVGNDKVAEIRKKLARKGIDADDLANKFAELRQTYIDTETLFELLNETGTALIQQKDFRAAEKYLLEALPLDKEQTNTIFNVNRLAEGLSSAGRMVELEQLYKNVIQQLGDVQQIDAAEMASLFVNYSSFLVLNSRFNEAEPLLRIALSISERNYHPNHPAIGARLNSLASLMRTTGRFTEAEPLMRRALVIAEQNYGFNHPDVAAILNNLAVLLRTTSRYAEAEPLIRRSLNIAENIHGANHPSVAAALNNLAILLQITDRLEEAEFLIRRALAINEQNYGPNHPDVANSLNNLAQLLRATSRYAEAEPLMRRSLNIAENSYGANHPNVATALSNLAALLQTINQLDEAEPLIRRALSIDEYVYGINHPSVAVRLNNLAMLLQETNRLGEAEPLIRRALAIDEQSYGPNHPDVAVDLNNLATLLQETNRLEEAELIVRRALAITENSYGPNHPDVAVRLNNLAMLLKETNRLEEAEPLMRRALEIFIATQNQTDRNSTVLDSYASLLIKMGKSKEEARSITEKIIKGGSMQ